MLITKQAPALVPGLAVEAVSVSSRPLGAQWVAWADGCSVHAAPLPPPLNIPSAAGPSQRRGVRQDQEDEDEDEDEDELGGGAVKCLVTVPLPSVVSGGAGAEAAVAPGGVAPELDDYDVQSVSVSLIRPQPPVSLSSFSGSPEEWGELQPGSLVELKRPGSTVSRIV